MNLPPPTRVHLCDDQPLVRGGLRMIIESADDLTVSGESADGAECLRALPVDGSDIVLMDVRMPVVNGVEATRHLRAAGLDVAVLVLTTFDLDEYAFAALRAGANGFLLKDAPPDELLTSIRRVAAGDAVLAPSTTRRLIAHVAPALPEAPPDASPEWQRLTEREQEVWCEVARGATNAEIGDRLCMAEGTVKTHVGRLLAKLGCRDRIGLVLLAGRLGVGR